MADLKYLLIVAIASPYTGGFSAQKRLQLSSLPSDVDIASVAGKMAKEVHNEIELKELGLQRQDKTGDILEPAISNK